MIAPWYAMLYTKLEKVAQRGGYCLAIHGSMLRDLDVVLIPWTEDAEPGHKVLRRIQKAIGGPHRNMALNVKETYHGRRTAAIHIGYGSYYLDVSIMPRRLTKQEEGDG